jgi:hypothetical protein
LRAKTRWVDKLPRTRQSRSGTQSTRRQSTLATISKWQPKLWTLGPPQLGCIAALIDSALTPGMTFRIRTLVPYTFRQRANFGSLDTEIYYGKAHF